MMGRPTSLTHEVAERILALVRQGNYRTVACRAAGIPQRTFWRWIQEGRMGHEPYAGFLQSLQAAEIDAETRLVERIIQAAETDIDAAKWYLERKAPARWGRDRGEIRELKRAVADLERRLADLVPDGTR